MSDYTTIIRTARLAHICDACVLAIRPGDRYERAVACGAGVPCAIHRHLGCAAALREIHAGMGDWLDVAELPWECYSAAEDEVITDAAIAAVASERWAVRARWGIWHQWQRSRGTPEAGATYARLHLADRWLVGRDRQRVAPYLRTPAPTAPSSTPDP